MRMLCVWLVENGEQAKTQTILHTIEFEISVDYLNKRKMNEKLKTKETWKKQKKKNERKSSDFMMLHPKQTLDIPLTCKYLWKIKTKIDKNTSMEYIYFHWHLNQMHLHPCQCDRPRHPTYILDNHHGDTCWWHVISSNKHEKKTTNKPIHY